MAHRIRFRELPLRRLLSVAAISLLLISCGGDDAANGGMGGMGGGQAGEPTNEAQAIFMEVGCSGCHGDQGQGVDGHGKSLIGTRMIPNAFQTRVRYGRGQQMPAYSEEEISDEEIEIVRQWLSSR
jgi:hypothetical protein